MSCDPESKDPNGQFFQAGLDLLGKGAEGKEWGSERREEGDVLNNINS